VRRQGQGQGNRRRARRPPPGGRLLPSLARARLNGARLGDRKRNCFAHFTGCNGATVSERGSSEGSKRQAVAGFRCNRCEAIVSQLFNEAQMIRAARELMEVYRSEAAAIAEKRAIHLDACGERRAATTWRQIGDAVCGPSKPKTRRAVQAAPRRYAARQRLTSFKRATSRSGKRPCGVSRKRSITAQRARVVATSRPPAGLTVSIRLSRNQKLFVEHATSLETLCDSSPRITSWRF
jgi:hypothetical protein